MDPTGELGKLYDVTYVAGVLSILKATPIIGWPPPAPIVAGAPLGVKQFKVSASDPFLGGNVDGTFVYSPGPGAVLAPGTAQALRADFTPTDGADYATATAFNQLDVSQATQPAITSPLTASSALGTNFFYAITTSGSDPMVFDAGHLPPGISLTGNVLSGTPSASGLFRVTLTASNYAGADNQTLMLTILNSGANHAPVFASVPIASLNPASVGIPITLSAEASDADSDALVYTWDFGDGTTDVGASVSKTFAVAGIYIVKVTVSDGQASTLQALNLVVQDLPPTGTFSVQRISVEFNFTRSGKYSLMVSGQIPLAPTFAPSGKSLRILIGGLDNTYSLNTSGDSSDGAFKLKGKMGGGSAPFAFMLKNQNLFAALKGLGFTDQNNANVDFPVIVVLDGTSYMEDAMLNYTVKSNKHGPQMGKGKN